MKIAKPESLTPTESLLSQLCDKLFLRLWSWPTPRKDDGKELCDLIAIFDDHVFIFFDRESKALRNAKKAVNVTWSRWKKGVIDKQVNTVNGAARYIRDGRPVFLDSRCEQPFPGVIPQSPIVHKIIVAHGAKEACETDSENNVYGSIGIIYSDTVNTSAAPFVIRLGRHDPVHVLDSFNLGIVLGELDTFHDFLAYITEKEQAIARYSWLDYAGEEDLLARYFMDHDKRRERYRIRTEETGPMLRIPEGTWKRFVDCGLQQKRREANKQSYYWDELIQRTYQNALDGTTIGASPWKGNDALREMAREPRLARRALSAGMLKSIRTFPRTQGMIPRFTFMSPLADESKMYVFLQYRRQDKPFDEYRHVRKNMLSIACGVVKNRYPSLETVVGIAMDAPMYSSFDGEDFVLLECEHWSDEDRAHYDRENEKLGLFKNALKTERRITDFG